MSSLSWCPLSDQFQGPFISPKPKISSGFPGRSAEAENTMCKDKILDIYKQYGTRGIINFLGYDMSHEIAMHLIQSSIPQVKSTHTPLLDFSKDDLILFAVIALAIYVFLK
jgi:hypothetical protein